MIKILITGANSFIGSNFIRYSRYQDIREISLLDVNPEAIDFSKFDVVLHLAAIVHQSKNIPESKYFEVNRDLCLKVADYAKNGGIKQFIFLSTVKVYGKSTGDRGIPNENSICEPDNAYGKSKLEAETGLRDLEDASFKVSIVRTPLVYGNGVKANMHKLIRLIELSPVLPFGNIKASRNYTYTENLVGYIDRIIEKEASGIFIAMDNDPVSTTDLVLFLSKSLGRKPILFRLPDLVLKMLQGFFPLLYERLFENQVFDNKLTNTLLDYVPPHSTEEGLIRMVKYFKKKENLKNIHTF